MKTRVLVVDDEIDTLRLLNRLLDIAGYEPITTLNSVEAIALAETENPDVVLLDIMMPDLDGFTLCKMMRANQATQYLPIIFVTAYSALDLEERRKEAGADLLISKPITMDVLVETIDRALELHPGRFGPPGKPTISGDGASGESNWTARPESPPDDRETF